MELILHLLSVADKALFEISRSVADMLDGIDGAEEGGFFGSGVSLLV